MVKIHPLYSSSSGNMFHMQANKTNILIDVGVSYKAIIEGLKSIDKSISDINAVLITHEHVDHIKGLPLLCRKNNIPIYTCSKTANYLNEMLGDKNIPADIYGLEYGQTVKIKNVEVTPFETSHDAVMPCGFRINSDETAVSFATDLGYVSNEVYDNLRASDYIVLESNYDKSMLEYGKYPFPLKRRIKSNLGHLSNDDTADTLLRLAKDGQSKFLLAHLSENNNDTNIARSTILDTLKNEIDITTLDINFASKLLSDEVYSLC